MKKYLYILIALLFGAVSCSVDGPKTLDAETQEGKVTVLMKVTLPEPLMATKGIMADEPVIDNLHVAVFGGNGYLNDYTRAVRCDAEGKNLSQDWSDIKNGQTFYFKVTLTATQSERSVHIIANGPDQLDFNTYENELMQHLTTSDNNGAYWQYFLLPNGTVQEDGETLSEEAEAAFSDVKLIRNFAKVSVSVASSVTNFSLTGFKVFNNANGGSVAIWDGTKYLTDYATASMASLRTDYPNGFVPEGVSYDTTKPAADADGENTFDTNSKYVYERPAGTSADRPYIILKGRFLGDAVDTYYRLDFVNRDGEYLPIYRNFAYNITLTSVAKSGVADPSEAKASNANVSSIDETENLSDIADGVSRLYVMWLDNTYAEAHASIAFKYLYLPDATDDDSSKAASITWVSGKDEAISELANSDWSTGGGEPDQHGWRTIHFKVNEPGEKEVTSTFQVTGQTSDGQKLYRKITVHLLPKQEFKTPTITSAGAAVNSKVTVNFPLPNGLPASAFPLEIMFEDNPHVLNPFGTDMPTNIGTTITGGTGTSFQFVKTISYTEYNGDADKVFPIEFKRIKTGATILYFDNKFFKKENDPCQLIPN